MIKLSKVTYPVKNPVLKEITLEFNEGEITGIIGRSGSGKTSLLNLLSLDNKVRSQTDGLIHLKGKPAFALEPKETARLIVRSDIVPENTDELLDNFLLLSRIPHKKLLSPFLEYDLKLTDLFIERFELTPFRKHSLNSLTAGFFKRTLLAFSFIREADIILLDNPTANLDFYGIKILYKELIKSVIDGKRSVIIASHDINFIAEIADRILILENGQIAEDMHPDKLDSKTLKKYLSAETIISKNIYNGRPLVHLFPDD